MFSAPLNQFLSGRVPTCNARHVRPRARATSETAQFATIPISLCIPIPCVIGQHAPPVYNVSAPRVRSFAERALEELRSGEGEASPLSDKQTFSEFMYRVTER